MIKLKRKKRKECEELYQSLNETPSGAAKPRRKEKKKMSKYNVYYYNDETKKTKIVIVKATGIVPAIEEAVRKHLDLLGWEIVKAEKI